MLREAQREIVKEVLTSDHEGLKLLKLRRESQVSCRIYDNFNKFAE